MNKYDTTVRWTTPMGETTGRSSVVHAPTVGDALGIALEKVECNTRPHKIEVISVKVEKVS